MKLWFIMKISSIANLKQLVVEQNSGIISKIVVVFSTHCSIERAMTNTQNVKHMAQHSNSNICQLSVVDNQPGTVLTSAWPLHDIGFFAKKQSITWACSWIQSCIPMTLINLNDTICRVHWLYKACILASHLSRFFKWVTLE